MAFKVAFFLLAVVAAASCFPQEAGFGAFVAKHKKVYSSAQELAYRKQIFAKNVAKINKHNEEAKAGKHSWLMGVNQFTDMTEEEFSMKYGTFIPTSLAGVPVHNSTGKAAPESIDYRDQGYVTDVKDQKQCGSCWAFSAAAAVEGAFFKAGKGLVDLSTQLYVDCDTGSYGCSGGFMETAFDYTKSHGAELWTDYTYTGRDGSCKFDSSKVFAKTSSYVSVDKSEAALEQALVEAGPISVALNANGFMSYSSGVFDGYCYGGMNHALLLAGYGVDNGKEYWLIKNSWGKYWGENGYLRLAKNHNKLCHISDWASYPIA